MVNVGVIGCGKIAQTRHLPEYADNPDVNIVALYDFNVDRAKELAEEYHAKVYESYQELLDDPGIDAVSVCVRNSDHCAISIDAMKAGKHVLCEKPMAVSLEECIKMVEASEKYNRFLMIGQNQRLSKAHVKAKELIQSGMLGKVLTFKTNFGHGGPETWTVDQKDVWFFDKSLSAFGALADLGVHKTDLITYLLDSPVKKVTAVLKTLDKKDADGNPIAVDDNSICIYEMENGVVGTMTASWTYYGAEDNSTVIYGTNGMMRIYDDPEYSIVVTLKDGSKVLYDIDRIQTNDNQTKSGIIDAWVESLVENKEPEISGKSVLSSMKAIFAALESSKSNTTVVIE
ncbi:MAG: Gfo/Idh/MocA family protein [Candidatus Alectryocaccobium sp.]|jgi:predicted dehydrogenase